MKTLTITADGVSTEDRQFPRRSITMEWDEDVVWVDIVEGLRDALNGLGYIITDDVWEKWKEGE